MVPAALDGDDARPLGQGVEALVQADALILVPADTGEIAAGRTGTAMELETR